MNNTEIVNAILASRNASHEAYDRVLPEIQAVDPDKVRSVNVEVTTAVSRVLGAAPKILALCTDQGQKTPGIDFASLRQLETYAYALQEAHVRCLSSGKSPDELRALTEEGDSLRALLRSDVAALVNRGLIDPARVSSCQGQPGYKTIATELGILASVMLSCWPQIQGKSCVSEQELRRAQSIAEALLAYLGSREQSPEAKAAASEVRDRAFTLLADNYDIARRVVTYLRWNDGDADQIAPSLYGGKRRSRRDDNDDDNDDVPAVTPGAAPVNTTPANTTPANPIPGNSIPANGTPLAGPAPGGGSGSGSPTNILVGRPDSNPFMQ